MFILTPTRIRAAGLTLVLGAGVPWIAPARRSAAEEPARPPAGKVLLVALVGKLSPEEVSPRDRSPAPALWRIAVDGVSLTRVDFRSSVLPSASIDALRTELLPPRLVEGSGDPVLIELPPAPAEGAPESDGKSGDGSAPAAPRAEIPRAIRNLHGLYRAPPPEGDEEKRVVEAIRKAVKALGSTGATGPPGKAAAGSPGRSPRPHDEDSAEREIAAARVALARIEAKGAEPDEVSRRDGILRRLIAAAGEEAHIIIALMPAEGEGSMIARGPLFKSGWVIDERRPPGRMKAAIGRLLDPAGATSREETDEIFR